MQVRHLDVRRSGEVGDGARDLDDAMVGARAEAETVEGLAHEGLRIAIEWGEPAYFANGQKLIELILAQKLNCLCACHSLPHRLARLAAAIVFMLQPVALPGDLDVHIDAIQ